MIDISAKIISDFGKITKAAKKASDKALKSAGAYVRKVVRSSIKSKKEKKDGERPSSEPGKPPFSWKQPGLEFKDSILFAVDGEAVVVGPIAGNHGKLGQLHEFGGQQVNKVWDKDGKKEISVLATYPARPFMGPALEKSKDKISSFWADAIK